MPPLPTKYPEGRSSKRIGNGPSTSSPIGRLKGSSPIDLETAATFFPTATTGMRSKHSKYSTSRKSTKGAKSKTRSGWYGLSEAAIMKNKSQILVNRFATAYIDNTYLKRNDAKCRVEKGISAFLVSVNNDLIPVNLSHKSKGEELIFKTKLTDTDSVGKKIKKIPGKSITRIAYEYADIVDLLKDCTITREETHNIVCVQMSNSSILPIMLLNETDKHYFVSLLRVVKNE